MKKKFWVKVMVWVLTILMIGSCCTVLFSSLFGNTALLASAAEATAETAASTAVETAVETTAEAKANEPVPIIKTDVSEHIAAGLVYGSDVTAGFGTVTTVGFKVHAVTLGRAERFYEEIFTIDYPEITVVCDDNLSKTAYTYSVYNGTSACVVGGHHIETVESYATLEEARAALEFVENALLAEGSAMHPFIAYIRGSYKVRISDYSTEERIREKLLEIPLLCEQMEFTVTAPSKTGVSILRGGANTILFEFDDGGARKLGLTAMPRDGEKQYLRTPEKRLYDGVFVYERYVKDKTDGVAITNLLPLEDYIAGVVPYEISPRWPAESLRAFAIAVRGYTVKNRNRHFSSNGFDICNTTHCQVYRGIADANDAVFNAVKSTEGLVLCYGNTIVPTYYSSSTGGYTASAKDTWGSGDYPYLAARYTPWERYSEHGKGLWVTKVSGTELAQYLRSRGYTKLAGESIVDIKINGFSGDGPYVYSITFTDSSGNSVTVTRCDKVRGALTRYLNSGNFIVGRGSLTYSYDEVVSIDMSGNISVTTGGYAPLGEGRAVLSASGLSMIEDEKLYVRTGSTLLFATGDIFVANGESCYYYDMESAPGVILRRITKTEVADENTFIFAGKGWGHGVGLSQYGVYDLAVAGASAEQILKLYFPDLEIKDYRDME